MMAPEPLVRRRGRPKAETKPNYDGSEPLSAPRRELFCALHARVHETSTAAYIGAGYQAKTKAVAAKNASRLKSREPGIVQRVTYLKACDEDTFELAFAEARRRVEALDASQGAVSNEVFMSSDGHTPPSDTPELVTRDTLIRSKEVLDFVIAASRALHERSKELGLSNGNLKKRILSLYGSAVIRCAQKLDRLATSDAIMSVEHGRQNAADCHQLTMERLGKLLDELQELPACTCGAGNAA